jgi:hypothetical protein
MLIIKYQRKFDVMQDKYKWRHLETFEVQYDLVNYACVNYLNYSNVKTEK